MGAIATPVRIRHDLHPRLASARVRSDELFGIVREDALYDRPIAERHRIIFYLGHLEEEQGNYRQALHYREIELNISPEPVRVKKEIEELKAKVEAEKK